MYVYIILLDLSFHFLALNIFIKIVQYFCFFAKAHFMKPNSTFETIQENVQKYVKYVFSVSVRITETGPVSVVH